MFPLDKIARKEKKTSSQQELMHWVSSLPFIKYQIFIPLPQQKLHAFLLCWNFETDRSDKMFNPKLAGTELYQFNYVNIMVTDALAPCIARTSAPMILTL